MATYVPPKKNTAFIMYVGLPSATNSSTFQSNPTLASGDAKVSIDGGALANLGTLPVVTPASSKMVKITMASGEMNGDNITIILSDQTSPPEWVDVIINIQTSARQVDDLAFPNTSGRGMDVDASGGVEVGSFQAGAITAAAIATDAIDADALAADAGTEIGTAVWATAARTLTALDEDTTTLDLDATIRAAVGMASANLDTQLTGINTNIDANEAKIDIIDTNVDAILVDTGTDIPASITNVDSDLAALVADIGANGSGLTALPWNSSWDAEVESEVSDALTAYDAATGSDVPSAATVADAVWDEALSGHVIAGSAGDTLSDIGAGGSAPTVDQIADEVESRVLDVNIVQVNDVPVQGTGTEIDPWGP